MESYSTSLARLLDVSGMSTPKSRLEVPKKILGSLLEVYATSLRSLFSISCKPEQDLKEVSKTSKYSKKKVELEST